MRIKKKVLEKIDESDTTVVRLVRELKVSYPTVRRWINANEEDGQLTTATAVKIIREELGLPDSQILEETKTAA